MASALTAQSRASPTPWESLPLSVLGQCMPSGSEHDHHAARAPFATCKAFANAVVVTNKTCLTVDVDHYKPAVTRVLQWTAEWDADVGLRLAARNTRPTDTSIRPFLQDCAVLPNISRIVCEGVLLDARAPTGFGAVFRNLKELQLDGCPVPVGQLPLAGCSNLQSLVLAASNKRSYAGWRHQLQHLNSLPSLSSLTLNAIQEYPTSCLPLLAGGQLTQLHLHHRGGGSSAKHIKKCEKEWQAAIGDAAQLTQLRVLSLSGPSITVQHLKLLRPLTQLQDLQISDCWYEEHSATLIPALLQFTHLTRLALLDEVWGLEQSYADQPCSWQQLRLKSVTPAVLAQLPLHSLTHPLQLACLQLDAHSTPADIQQAVDNLARSGAPTVQGWGTVQIQFLDDCFMDPVGESDAEDSSAQMAASKQAALLRAAAPLVPQGTTTLGLWGFTLVSEVMLALQGAVPATVTSLHVEFCTTKPCMWPQLARSFPQLEHFKVVNSMCWYSAEELLDGFTAAVQALHGQQGAPRAPSVDLTVRLFKHERHEASSFEQKVTDINTRLRALGVCTPAGSPTTVRMTFVS